MLEDKLKDWFGFKTFKPGQKDIIQSVLEGKHTLGILPTGSGKSLCYQFPTYLIEKPTLVISPLISLMDDQVMQMKLNGESQVAYIHSGMDEVEKRNNIKRLPQSRFIYLSPEYILQPQNFKLISRIDFGLIVLDEAHCLSEWGYDFRPHYALIGQIISHFKHARVLALTATAPPHLDEDLTQILNVKLNVIKTSMSRENISLQHRNFNDDDEKIEWLIPFLNYSGPTIIYISSKKKCLELANLIYDAGFLTGIYHGDLSYQERQTVQQQFLNNDIPVIVATSAFGMGINKKDIRTVIHFHLSSSPSNYLQEIGRAGRDGKLSQAISLYQPDDRFLLETLLFTDMITDEDISMFELGDFLPPDKKEILETLYRQFSVSELRSIFKKSYQRKRLGYMRMLGYKDIDQCRRNYLLEFFNEHPDKPNQCCDNDTDLKEIKNFNRKKVKRKMTYEEKLKNLFEP
ncbi:RecQ family ATP-dependent DNA helicase [Staphylococcus caprae]|uniref:ATP-dependent DNA helicase RecQ n=2 Tax=Staphylococcus TaxID=1279 RepID=A0ABN5W3P9_9STAP|nr:ATP-dependent DNA helicase RecQ [Staphylococcus caprae]EES40127.1 ATP-dependent DNA helicase, RecQ family [Staphylococcus caprae M23864:W1]MBN6825637.1 ATP-dependent DNA helicase RecQ [Staphylococcus caprae]MBU5270905.1 ATP-dependent DNA helicase [Staphylococcus caprae]MBX5316550.1 ATP-dependent DNA helicase RecQ [Staphylococcus caprae]MBX5323056.1 ATP-dependent DNA helicase RecQ [Staphylococcus caprae]